MKHLPNLLTLGNLFCGCLAIAYILTAQPFVYKNLGDGSLQWIMGTEQLYYGSIFIGIAAVCDMSDGMAARMLNVHSAIGKDLDSLADLVSFGVAPSMIMFKILWDASMQQANALDTSMLSMAPAFLIACFGALRLAMFNNTTAEQKYYFVGMPTPAVGLFVGAMPLILWKGHMRLPMFIHEHYKWVLYLFIALLCWLMVSKVKFFKMVPRNMKLANSWPQLTLVVLTAASFPFLGLASFIFAFLLYVVLSLVYKYPEDTAATN
jgi:CDP-diacylglycerol--serine O-phosphatidyltransferase